MDIRHITIIIKVNKMQSKFDNKSTANYLEVVHTSYNLSENKTKNSV